MVRDDKDGMFVRFIFALPAVEEDELDPDEAHAAPLMGRFELPSGRADVVCAGVVFREEEGCPLVEGRSAGKSSF